MRDGDKRGGMGYKRAIMRLFSSWFGGFLTRLFGAEAAAFDRRQILAWATYDWANSAFATTVMAGFLPVFFSSFWGADSVQADGSNPDAMYRLATANSLAGLLVAVMAPILGAIADKGSLKKRLLILFAFLGVVSTVSLALVEQGQWFPALFLYVVATIGFSGANSFYDSMLVDVAGDERLDAVSLFGFSAGYLGGGVLFLLNVLMVLHPDWFGLADKTAAVRASFVTVGIWWAVFTIPIMLFVPDDAAGAKRPPLGKTVREGLREFGRTFQELRRYRSAFYFLIAYWLYIDGVDTIVRMAGIYGDQLGLPRDSLITALLIVQFVGFPATLGFALIARRIGAKRGILSGIGVYIGVTVWAWFITETWEFYALAIVIGLVQGGVQALSRSLFQRLIPVERTTQFFGFYNMLGKFAVVLGPWLMGITAKITQNERHSILAVLVLFVAGGAMLLRLDVDAIERPPSARR